MKERRIRVKRYQLKKSSDVKVQANVSKFVGFFNVTVKVAANGKLPDAASENSPKGFLDVLVEDLECCQMGNYTPEEAKKRGWCAICRVRR